MRFWDSSAIVPLLVYEPESSRIQKLRDEDPNIAVWHWTPAECVSALERRRREGLAEPLVAEALARLSALRTLWTEVSDYEAVRRRTERCLRLHTLRAADAGQLAAALVLTDRLGLTLPLVTLDGRLAAAACREGFEVLHG